MTKLSATAPTNRIFSEASKKEMAESLGIYGADVGRSSAFTDKNTGATYVIQREGESSLVTVSLPPRTGIMVDKDFVPHGEMNGIVMKTGGFLYHNWYPWHRFDNWMAGEDPDHNRFYNETHETRTLTLLAKDSAIIGIDLEKAGSSIMSSQNAFSGAAYSMDPKNRIDASDIEWTLKWVPFLKTCGDTIIRQKIEGEETTANIVLLAGEGPIDVWKVKPGDSIKLPGDRSHILAASHDMARSPHINFRRILGATFNKNISMLHMEQTNESADRDGFVITQAPIRQDVQAQAARQQAVQAAYAMV